MTDCFNKYKNNEKAPLMFNIILNLHYIYRSLKSEGGNITTQMFTLFYYRM